MVNNNNNNNNNSNSNNNNNNNAFSLITPPPQNQPFLYVLRNPNLKKEQQRPLLRGWKHLLSVVALKVLTSSINLFVQFFNLGYCDSASRVLTPLNPLLWYETPICRRPMKPEFLPMKSEKRKKFVFILMFPFSTTIFVILLYLKFKCQILQFLLVQVLLESDSANRD